jgi:23S rRNA pseudouridine2605 synthase
MSAERLQKILARAGFGSRRACETLIQDGRVLVNGQRVELGSKADPQVDKIVVDGQALAFVAQEFVYIAVNKPRGILSSPDTPQPGKKGTISKPRKTVLDLVDYTERLFPVGRLDADSEGLMLLTNDGALANRLTHPRYGHEKEYRVLVARHPDEVQLSALRHGIVLEDGYRTAPAHVWVEGLVGKGAWLRFVISEGRKRQVREMCMRIGLPVVRLTRIRIGTLLLGRLKSGEWRHLSDAEVALLKKKPERVKG